jgi:AcrR family transcriptional regulator
MRDSEQTKSRILAAALDEFAVKGLAGARVDEIARVAGANKAMIYYYFENKEGLFNALFQSELQQLKNEFAAILTGRDVNSARDIAEALRQILSYADTKKKFLGMLLSQAALQESFQAYLFQLAELSTQIGIEVAENAGQKLPAAGWKESVLYELLTGLLPLAFFVLLRSSLQSTYGWDPQALTDQFVATWLHQHTGHEISPASE